MRQVIITLFLITFFGAFLRFYQLTKYPVHLGHDEISQLYDAISIVETGKDAYGNKYPFIFRSVEDYKPPFYTYITALSYKIFGWRELTIRIPGAVFGTLIIPAVFLFSYLLFKNRLISLASSFIAAISPFEIFFSRKSFENQAGVLFILLGFSLLLKYIKTKQKKWFYSALLILAGGMYTYFSHAILIPLLILAFYVIFLKNLKEIIVLPIIIFAILIIPLAWQILANPDARNRTKAVRIIQDPKLGENISYSGPFLKYKTIADYSFTRYLQQFDPIFLFGNGLDLTKQSFPDMGVLYFLQLPLIVLGTVFLIKEKNWEKEKQLFLIFVLIGTIPSGLTFEEHSPHRMVLVFTLLNIVSALGLTYLSFFSQRLTRLWWVLFAFSLLYFSHLYLVNYSFEKSEFLHYPFKEVALYAWEKKNEFEQIIFDPKFGGDAPMIGTATHYYLAYYGHYPPADFQKEYRKGTREREILFDKFSIRAVDWREDYQLKNSLIIASEWSLPPLDQIGEEKIVRRFSFFNGKPAFYAVELE